jgi:hypothetical protein
MALTWYICYLACCFGPIFGLTLLTCFQACYWAWALTCYCYLALFLLLFIFGDY